ncbi:MAG: flagellar hook-length control protein FliK, partial [Kiritimatiellae bacterium]|nr:flagellar hook-length control protein FliK [Kiritimatiellia bacterium]
LPPSATAIPAAPQPLPEAQAATAASARTATLADTANQIASAIASRILVTPSMAAGGDGEVRIFLQPTVLDGSAVTLTARDGTLSVTLTPSTPDAAQLAAAALPQLTAALSAHTPAFRHVHVTLAAKKGNPDETA